MSLKKYTIEVDNEGRRCWLCTHPSGEQEPLPPGFTLLFPAGEWRDSSGPHSLRVGTTVWLEEPANADQLERETAVRVLRARIERKRGEGLELTELEEAVLEEVLREIGGTGAPEGSGGTEAERLESQGLGK